MFNSPQPFDNQGHKFEAYELVPLIEQVPEGSVFYTQSDHITAGASGRLRIDARNGYAYPADMASVLLDLAEEEFSRVIKVSDGYVVDESHFDITTPLELNDRFAREATSPWDEPTSYRPEYMPVVGWAGNEAQWEQLQEALSTHYNLVIDEENILTAGYMDDGPGSDEDEAHLP